MRLFDLHCDTLYECYTKQTSMLENDGHLDWQSGLSLYDAWIQVFAVWMPDTLRGAAAFRQCCAALDYGHAQVEAHAESACVIRQAADLDRVAHRCGVLFSVEGGSALAGKMENLAELKKRDVKLITLTWNGSNELGNGALAEDTGGLTAFGKEAVREMEQLHLLPDVSHLNRAGVEDVLEQTTGPVLATHSVSAAVHDHPRNLTDAQFDALVTRGGLVGLNLCPKQLGEQSFERLEEHLNHYWERDGERTVALGMDLDGTDLRPDWHGIALAGQFYDYLSRKNYEEALLSQLFFGNCYDFFRRH